MSVIKINSDTLISTTQHFKVTAGPGAGKTYWLVNHMKNVLHNSNQLGKVRKIACITYTNVAVETIIDGIGESVDQVEVSTIHSFLYKHIVKPYAQFLDNDYNLNVEKLDGHDDIVLSNYSFLKGWKDKTGQKRIRDDAKVVEAIAAAKWRFDSNNNLIVKPDYPRKVDKYSIKNDSYFEYKKMAWEKGVVHHDDVLFFSYQLIKNYPFILQVLRAKFPYFFIDEFQDTSPIQAKLLKLIGQEETVIGIVGDKAQSIYGFQGADSDQIDTFSLSKIVNYSMVDNRRSTNQIIDFLNAIRSDITQNKYKNKNGKRPTLVIGEKIASLKKIQEQYVDCNVCTLARDNITSNAIKNEMSFNVPVENLFLQLQSIDSNRERRQIVIACIKAVELARLRRFKEAIKELERYFKDKNDKDKGKKEALKIISMLLGLYKEIRNKPIMELHSFINTHVKKVTAFKSGKPKEFYEKYTFEQFAVCVKNIEDPSYHRTIHKAKGAEFEVVLLLLKEEKDLDFILNPKLETDEEHRINYVAASRAKKDLFISVPSISDETRERISPIVDIIPVS